ncbi:calpain family cysteine protease domain-containing [Cryptosporidium sp. chipmunk genotype I]|uniref:calpain family cysteine protease domain-containing n=1 Tax=Cryptosporidium sp. chipmunk genotype I TaxID=1280935 RepID=UPI003519D853|nr:calpain family cysteine protease domain-containing [Cryptosporidium sp. chipmunk genotype I]
MLISKLFKRKTVSPLSSVENVNVEIDHLFELKKMVMEKYKSMMKLKGSDQDQINYQIFIESSFINDSCFLPPLLINKKSGTKLTKLTKLNNNQVQFLLLMLLYNQQLSFQEDIIDKSTNICLKEQYILIVEQMVKSLILSKKQKKMVVRWKKLNSSVELFPNNHFMYFTSSNIIQGFTGDCSFIVVLSLLLEHEKKFDSNLLSSLISPIRFSIKNQTHHIHNNTDDYSTIHYNDNNNNINELDDVLCLYRCKLLINGIWRNIFVDSLIPIDSGNNCLLSHFDSNKYYGITLIEKAYLKVMANRYDSIESNPSIDLYYLTGWIPETISIKSNYEKKKIYFLNLWNRIKKPIQNGYCLMALGTNEINSNVDHHARVNATRYECAQDKSFNRFVNEFDNSQSENKYITKEEICKKTGLVTKHAYQVLRIVELVNQENDSIRRLLLLRNPWGKISWKGKFSKYDKEIWNSELEELLGNHFGYNINHDNGIFWIEWSDILKWFSHIYLAWDPEKVSKHFKKVHGKWIPCSHNSILKDDLHLVYFYPQYKLSINCKLLSKLKMDTENIFNQKEFICQDFNQLNSNNKFNISNSKGFKLHFDSNRSEYIQDYSKTNLFGRMWKKSDVIDPESSNCIGDIWIVLNRHIDYLGDHEFDHNSTKSDINNVPFMSISIFRGRNRIVTQERLPIMQGVYSNGNVITFKTNIFQLLREYEHFDLQENKDFILIITQYQSSKSFNYTLNIYSNIEIGINLLDSYFQKVMYPINSNYNFTEINGKILHYNFTERYYISLMKNSKLKLAPATSNKYYNSKNGIIQVNHLNSSRADFPDEHFRLLILLEIKEKCNNFKLRLFPETFDDQDKIIKLGSSNDSYNNSNCKFITSICSYGNYFILIDFKEKQQEFIKDNFFKLIIYYQKI